MSAFDLSTPWFHIIIPRRLGENGISLRPARISDSRFIHAGFCSKDFLIANDLTKPIGLSGLAFWWWLRKTFVFSYCILVNGRPCGFLGLHSVQPGNCGEISLAIFDTGMRRQRIGSRAFSLFAHSLERHSFIKTLFARVKEDNQVALAFWKKLGFVELGKNDSVIVLSCQQLLSTSSRKHHSDE